MNTTSQSTPWFVYSILVLAMLLWGSSFIALKIAFSHYSMWLVIFARMLIATLCFLACFRRISFRQYQPGDLKLFLMMVLCEPCLYFIFESLALEHTSAAQAGAVTALYPALVTIGAWLVLKEKPSKLLLTGLVIAFIGALWLTFLSEKSEHAPNPLLGNFLELIAMILAAFYTIVLKKLAFRYNAITLTAVQSVAGTLFFLPFALNSDLPTQIELEPTLAIIYLGSVVTCGAYGLYNYGVSQLSANSTSTFVNLIPVFTVILAAIILDEWLTTTQLIAVTLILTGVIIGQQKWQLKAQRKPEADLT
ncbi:DMT family transporter [Spartinivicinus poritis]|uniref:DMT family transporter n=1 Tax=Spartinivicinus poritis TaxID=2994640 RepID=A0ABT5UF32_9GAMM|nr:DMT family transporter [Spartinivicinus sp. A2-2]MDE1464994.1 DMT family transporter [Spartinivicinus sp. A2-2]